MKRRDIPVRPYGVTSQKARIFTVNEVKNSTLTSAFQFRCNLSVCNFRTVKRILRSLHNSVGIVTRYGLDGPGIESRLVGGWGSRFYSPVQTGSEAHPASYTMGTESFPGIKRPGRGLDHQPHLAPRLNKEQSYSSTSPLCLRGLLKRISRYMKQSS